MYQPWLQDTAGRWQSQEIAATFGMDGELAAVYSSDGQRQLREGEISRELAELRRQVEQLKQQG